MTRAEKENGGRIHVFITCAKSKVHRQEAALFMGAAESHDDEQRIVDAWRTQSRQMSYTHPRLERACCAIQPCLTRGLYRVMQERVGRTPLDFRKHCRSGRWHAPASGDGMVSSF
jgi:hypothetical protein